MAFNVFSIDEYAKVPAKYKKNRKEEWFELCAQDEEEIPEEFIKELMGFRKIVESNLPDDEMAKAIDDYLSENPIFTEEHFGELDEDASLSHGQEWFASKLSALGLPAAWELYAEGYTTIEKCLEINPDDFVKRKGIGPKKKQQLITFQENNKRPN